MLLRTVFEMRSRADVLDRSLDLPLSLELAEGISARIERGPNGELHLVLDRAIDVDRLEFVAESGISNVLPDGTLEPEPALQVRDDDSPEYLLAANVMSSIAFLLGERVTHHSTRDTPPRFVPEGDDDQAILDRFGTDKRFLATSVLASCRTFTARITAGGLRALLDRAVGTRIYADAGRLGFASARFRELWRVLESGFRAKDNKLVGLLASYPPATHLGFDRQELRDLLVLRGRASHADSRTALQELIRTDRECARRVDRLNTLVERVLLTKKDWGTTGLDVEEMAPVQAYVKADGTPVFVRHPAPMA